MVTVFDVNPNLLIDKAAEDLKNFPEIKAPSWAAFVKTSPGREIPPIRSDWWYVRAAAVLRTIYIRGPIGTEKLRVKYGARRYRSKSRQPEHFVKASGSIIRKILQQLQASGLVEFEAKSVQRGRMISGTGKKFLDDIAKVIGPPVEEKIQEKVEEKPEEKPEEKAEEKAMERAEAKPEKKGKAGEKKEKAEEKKEEKAVERAEAKPEKKEKAGEKKEEKAEEKKEKAEEKTEQKQGSAEEAKE